METIFALSSAMGKSAVCLFRISGPQAFDTLKYLGVSKIPKHATSIVKKIYDTKQSSLIDKAVITCFYSPKSFTGEDIVEICCHGSMHIIHLLTDVLNRYEFIRLAEPGEFSRRAFLNNKINLTQAEAIADLIDAQTDAQHKQALRQLDGLLYKTCCQWVEKITSILALLEANVDFPEEDIPISTHSKIQNLINQLLSEINIYLSDENKGEKLRNGIHLGIFGRPNVGKSSLINILSKQETSIVTQHAGTTTDLIKTQLDIAGYPITVIDTAGIRDNPNNEIEKAGIERANSILKQCDIKIIMLEPTAAVQKIDFEIFKNDIHKKNTIIVINKADLKTQNAESIQIDHNYSTVKISCKNLQGIHELTKIIIDKCNNIALPEENSIITRIRHRKLIQDTAKYIKNSINTNDFVLKSEEIRYALNSINQISGTASTNKVLDEIFSQFCIGK